LFSGFAIHSVICSPTKSGDTNTSPKTLPYLPVPKLLNLKTPCSSNSLFLAFASKPFAFSSKSLVLDSQVSNFYSPLEIPSTDINKNVF
jgi:hypothetical protein